MIFSKIAKKLRKNKYRFVISKTGLIVYDRKTPATIRLNEKETQEILKRHINFDKYDYFCEVAHLEISNKCNMSCKYCYVGTKKEQELTTNEWKKIIKNLANTGIFQVSFGGGEPTLRKDLYKLAKYVNKLQMNLGMTTNGTIITHLNPKILKRYFKQINISWHNNIEVVKKALYFLKKYNIPCGINYFYSKFNKNDNNIVKSLAKEFKAELLYLVYKPVIGDWENQISGSEVFRKARESANEGILTAVDGPCINKCMMKRKFIDVDSLGNVYPCSFVRTQLGNLLDTSFEEIWLFRGEQDICPFVKLENKEIRCGK